MKPLQIPGIPNGYIVDRLVWRGAQPEDSAWPQLAAAGCKLVIDLSNTGDEALRQTHLVAAAAGMAYFPAGWDGILPPGPDKIRGVLRLMDAYADSGEPMFVHCLHGSDRTGTLCACWRIHHDGWNFEDAMEEAFLSLGFQGMHEFWMAAAVAHYAHHSRERK